MHAAVALSLGPLHLDVEVAVAAGEVVAVLGPNGAGKTTLLRLLAGLRTPDRGRVSLGDRVLADVAGSIHVPPADRRVGVVFQDHLLFPHLSVLENVAFGPRAVGVPAADARATARARLVEVGLSDRARDRPTQLSGGQAQRVALARALATDPDLLLLDEPLAALDVDTRRDVRALLRRHLAAFPGPAVVVTHDPVEALTLADRLVVLEGGRVTQDGPPAEVTARPRSRWVAELVGLNLLRGVADGTTIDVGHGVSLRSADPASGPVAVVVHPRAVAVHRRPPDGSPRNVLTGEVADLDVRGDHVRVRVDGPVPLVAEVTPDAVAALDLGAGGPVHLAVKATELRVHPEGS
ncbi:ABC transporter ATP-binding protein [Nitriliruptoraceae bacterium ZYF776]|nr:ABC transporter ATP-binding protein [Profundirhabdus halotolerans]